MDADDDVLKILIASDVHLGLNERDTIRRDDPKNTFEEMFSLANEHGVDLVLLTGNLFHENKPSRKALQSAIEVLRAHCLGDRDIGMEIVSEQGAALHGKNVNYEDPNYNVQLPCFAIHGDHDDPGGEGGLSALDILSSANLLNYFGKTEVRVCSAAAAAAATPLASSTQPAHTRTLHFLTRIPSTLAEHREGLAAAVTHPQGLHTRRSLRPRYARIAWTPAQEWENLAIIRHALSLSFLTGHMRDEQLVRALERKEVTIARPVPEQNQEWFNLLAVHQNRAKSFSTATSTNAVKETLLPDCMDIVIWGARTVSPERPHPHTRSHAPHLLLPPLLPPHRPRARVHDRHGDGRRARDGGRQPQVLRLTAGRGRCDRAH